MAPTAAFRTLAPPLLERLASRVTATGDSVTIPAPFTGDDLATLPQSTAEDVRKAYDSAPLASGIKIMKRLRIK
ncbi:MAG: Aldehyde Dehydrogenase [Actinomycetia bacterium]|jgi:aldehyde dehydrogenase (NAD+)/succinate-semialdehyde dehydrogenase/glutarate-semialdehyde dehydrogenase|nr:Aldehyde Dehydrogenase [Actinomycetes bacterium]